MYIKLKRQEMEPPNPDMAFMLLASCNGSDTEQQLVISAISVVFYDSMETTHTRIFTGGIGVTGSRPVPMFTKPVSEVTSNSVFWGKEVVEVKDKDALGMVFGKRIAI